MGSDTDDARKNPQIIPLRKRRPDGTTYSRPEPIQQALDVLLRLPLKVVVDRSRLTDQSNPDYVPSECLLYFVRRSRDARNEASLGDLFTILRERVLRSVRIFARRLPGSKQSEGNVRDLDFRETVLDRFQEMLCRDSQSYDERLEFYEIRFNQALLSLRTTTRRDVQRAAPRLESLPIDMMEEPSEEVQRALDALSYKVDHEEMDSRFRSNLHMAISTLPEDERLVVELRLQGILIDSKEPNTPSIAKILGCSEKTVRNRLNRAYARLRASLSEEESE